MKKLLCAALLVLLLCGCSGTAEQAGRYQVYYRSTAANQAHASLAPVAFTPGTAQDDVTALVTQLFTAPTSTDVRSPYPAGTRAQHIELKERVLYLDVSEQYESLSGFSLSLADACITLTLCQLEEVDGVCITINGSAERLDRSNELLTPALYLLEEMNIDSAAESQ